MRFLSSAVNPHHRIKGVLHNLVLYFNKVGGRIRDIFLKRMVKIDAAEAEMSWLLFSSKRQAPKTLNPTFPIMQMDSIFH